MLARIRSAFLLLLCAALISNGGDGLSTMVFGAGWTARSSNASQTAGSISETQALSEQAANFHPTLPNRSKKFPFLSHWISPHAAKAAGAVAGVAGISALLWRFFTLAATQTLSMVGAPLQSLSSAVTSVPLPVSVFRGDSLWRLAERWIGAGKFWEHVAAPGALHPGNYSLFGNWSAAAPAAPANPILHAPIYQHPMIREFVDQTNKLIQGLPDPVTIGIYALYAVLGGALVYGAVKWWKARPARHRTLEQRIQSNERRELLRNFGAFLKQALIGWRQAAVLATVVMFVVTLFPGFRSSANAAEANFNGPPAEVTMESEEAAGTAEFGSVPERFQRLLQQFIGNKERQGKLDSATSDVDRKKKRRPTVKLGFNILQWEKGDLTTDGKLLGSGPIIEVDVPVWGPEPNKAIGERNDHVTDEIAKAKDVQEVEDTYLSILSAWQSAQASREMPAELDAVRYGLPMGTPEELAALQTELRIGVDVRTAEKQKGTTVLKASLNTSGQISETAFNPRELRGVVMKYLTVIHPVKPADAQVQPGDPQVSQDVLTLAQGVAYTRNDAERKYRPFFTKKLVPWKLVANLTLNGRSLTRLRAPIWWLTVVAPEWAIFSFNLNDQTQNVKDVAEKFQQARRKTLDRLLADFDALRRARLEAQAQRMLKDSVHAVLMDTEQPMEVRLRAARTFREALAQEKRATGRAEAIAERDRFAGVADSDIASIGSSSDDEVRQIAERTVVAIYEKVLAIEHLVRTEAETSEISETKKRVPAPTEEEKTVAFVEKKVRHPEKKEGLKDWKQAVLAVQSLNTVESLAPVPDAPAEADKAPDEPPTVELPKSAPFSAGATNKVSGSPDTAPIVPGIKKPTLVSGSVNVNLYSGKKQARELRKAMQEAQKDGRAVAKQLENNQKLAEAHLAAVREEARRRVIDLMLQEKAEARQLAEDAQTRNDTAAAKRYHAEITRIDGGLAKQGYVPKQGTGSSLDSHGTIPKTVFPDGYQVAADRWRLIGNFAEAGQRRDVGKATFEKVATLTMFVQSALPETFGAAELDIVGKVISLIRPSKPDTRGAELLENKAVLEGRLTLALLNQASKDNEQALALAQSLEQMRYRAFSQADEMVRQIEQDIDHTPEELHEAQIHLRQAAIDYEFATGELRAADVRRAQIRATLDDWNHQFEVLTQIHALEEAHEKQKAKELAKSSELSSKERAYLQRLAPFWANEGESVEKIRARLALIAVVEAKGLVPGVFSFSAGPFAGQFRPDPIGSPSIPLTTVGVRGSGAFKFADSKENKAKRDASVAEAEGRAQQAKEQMEAAAHSTVPAPDVVARHSAAMEVRSMANELEKAFAGAKATTVVDSHAGQGVIDTLRAEARSWTPEKVDEGAIVPLNDTLIRMKVPSAETLMQTALARRPKAVAPAEPKKKRSWIPAANFPFNFYYESLPNGQSRTFGVTVGVGNTYEATRVSTRKVKEAKDNIEKQSKLEAARQWRQVVRQQRDRVATLELMLTAAGEQLAQARANFTQYRQEVAQDARFRGDTEGPAIDLLEATQLYYAAWADYQQSLRNLVTALGGDASTMAETAAAFGLEATAVALPEASPTWRLGPELVAQRQQIRDFVRLMVHVPDPKVMAQVEEFLKVKRLRGVPFTKLLEISRAMAFAEQRPDSNLGAWEAVVENLRMAVTIEQAWQKARGPAMDDAQALRHLADDESALDRAWQIGVEVHQAEVTGRQLFGEDWPARALRWQAIAIAKAVQPKGDKLPEWLASVEPLTDEVAQSAVRRLANFTPERDFLETLTVVARVYGDPARPSSRERVIAEVRIAAAVAELGQKLGVFHRVSAADRQSLIDSALTHGRRFASGSSYYSFSEMAAAWEAAVKAQKPGAPLEALPRKKARRRTLSALPNTPFPLGRRLDLLGAAAQWEREKVLDRVYKQFVVNRVGTRILGFRPTALPPAGIPVSEPSLRTPILPPKFAVPLLNPPAAPARPVVSSDRQPVAPSAETATAHPAASQEALQKLLFDPAFKNRPEAAVLASLEWSPIPIDDHTWPPVIVAQSEDTAVTYASADHHFSMTIWRRLGMDDQAMTVERTQIDFTLDPVTGKLTLLDSAFPTQRYHSAHTDTTSRGEPFDAKKSLRNIIHAHDVDPLDAHGRPANGFIRTGSENRRRAPLPMAGAA